jgi:hypothetical protein
MYCWSAAFAARSSSTFGETNEEFGSLERGRSRSSRASTRICSFWAEREFVPSDLGRPRDRLRIRHRPQPVSLQLKS